MKTKRLIIANNHDIVSYCIHFSYIYYCFFIMTVINTKGHTYTTIYQFYMLWYNNIFVCDWSWENWPGPVTYEILKFPPHKCETAIDRKLCFHIWTILSPGKYVQHSYRPQKPCSRGINMFEVTCNYSLTLFCLQCSLLPLCLLI